MFSNFVNSAPLPTLWLLSLEAIQVLRWSCGRAGVCQESRVTRLAPVRAVTLQQKHVSLLPARLYPVRGPQPLSQCERPWGHSAPSFLAGPEKDSWEHLCVRLDTAALSAIQVCAHVCKYVCVGGVYMHVYTYACVCVCTCTCSVRICTHVQMCVHVCVCVYMRVHTCTCVCMCARTCVYVCVRSCVCTSARVHVCVHVCVYPLMFCRVQM